MSGHPTKIPVVLEVTSCEIVDAPEVEFNSDVSYEPDSHLKPEPKWGWNNAIDIAEGKRICQDYAGAPIKTKQGLNVVFTLAMRLRALGISKAVAVDLIQRYCTSPLSKADVSQECHSAYRAATVAPGYMSSARYAGANANAALIGPNPENPWPEATNDDGEAIVWPKPLMYQGKESASRCAERFLAERSDKLISSDGVLYTLEGNRIWRPLNDMELASEIRATDPTTDLDVTKIFLMVKAIHLARFTKARPFGWIDKPHGAPEPNDLILASNVILNMKTGESIPHSGRFFAPSLPDWLFDPDAECPLWLEKLSEWLDPSFHATLQEFCGYLLTADTSIEVMLAMIGAKRGVKGSITRVMQALVGSASHASMMLNDFAGDFGLSGLTDKRAIFIPDAHDANLSQRSPALERIKSIVGNDQVSVNRKNQSILSIKIPAKIVLVANKHPKFLDESGALADRELMLVFESSFAHVKDTELGGKLKAELSGIANWAIEGLRRLRANRNRFTIGDRGRKAQKDLAESQSPALRFANECLIVTGEAADFVPLDVAYAAYDHWATYVEQVGGRERRNKTDFRCDLMAALTERGVRYKRQRWRDPAAGLKHGNGTPTRGLSGVKMKPDGMAAHP
jgi:P4 family phage/plasmid primase-like protien